MAERVSYRICKSAVVTSKQYIISIGVCGSIEFQEMTKVVLWRIIEKKLLKSIRPSRRPSRRPSFFSYQTSSLFQV